MCKGIVLYILWLVCSSFLSTTSRSIIKFENDIHWYRITYTWFYLWIHTPASVNLKLTYFHSQSYFNDITVALSTDANHWKTRVGNVYKIFVSPRIKRIILCVCMCKIYVKTRYFMYLVSYRLFFLPFYKMKNVYCDFLLLLLLFLCV